MQNQNKKDYMPLIYDAITDLKRYRSVSGSEGVVYFLNDKFVLKEYVNIDDPELFEVVFDKYCKEFQMLSNNGFMLPKVYAWLPFVNMSYYMGKSKNKHRYFILEERVKGRELYVGEIEDAFHLIKDVCSDADFKKVMRGYYMDQIDSGMIPLWDEIVERYFGDYIVMNSMLEAMPQAEFDKFLIQAYKMYTDGEYLYPDLFPHNILVDEKRGLTIIDPLMTSSLNEGNGVDSSDYAKDVLSLFVYNTFVNKPRKCVAERVELSSKLKELSSENEKLTKAVLTRVLESTRLNIGDLTKTLKREDKVFSEHVLKTILKQENVEELYYGYF